VDLIEEDRMLRVRQRSEVLRAGTRPIHWLPGFHFRKSRREANFPWKSIPDAI